MTSSISSTNAVADQARSPQAFPRFPLLNVWADDLSMDELLHHLDAHGGLVYTVNPDHLYLLQHNPEFLQAYRKADLITVDSHYVKWSMRAMGRGIRHRLPGADIVPAYIRYHAKRSDTRIFLLGAKPGVAQRALENINARVGRELVVGAHGPSMNFATDAQEQQQALEMIRQSGATALFVGLGAPKQEMWLSQFREQMPNVKVLMGIGAVIDYEAGEVKRAPVIWQKLGIEWLYRVATEPGRYLRRYARNSRFFVDAFKDAVGRYRDPFAELSRDSRPQ